MSSRSTHVQVTCTECTHTGWARPEFTGWRCTDHRGQSEPVAPVLEPEPVANAHAGSPYRCRAHHDVRVDQRGKGCGPCARERNPRKEPKPDPLVIR